jgi:16S rRNA (cytosine1402-N4)-methyltransferase
MGSGDGNSEAAGGLAHHVPVLLGEALSALALKSGGRYLDGTFGAGGHTKAILGAERALKLLAIDRDPDALQRGSALVKSARGRLTLVEGRFGDLERLARRNEFTPLDGIVLDIGVSSMQVDEAARGFSFRLDGPLDMRMDGKGESAADIVNSASETRLADIIFHYGEERRARGVAHAIIEARRKSKITTTRQLADVVARIVRAEPRAPHPATRTFQALRIAVNDELGELARALHAAERALAPGGRLVVITFHSLEDRIVKQFLARRSRRGESGSRHRPEGAGEEATFTLVSRGPVLPSESEIAANPRARSAKLRSAERTKTARCAVDEDVMALAALPEATAGRARA